MKQRLRSCEKFPAGDIQVSKAATDRTPDLSVGPQEGYAAVLVAIIAGLLFSFSLTFVISVYYRPEIEQLLVEAMGFVTKHTAVGLAPEPVERLQFLACMLLVPVLLISIYYAFDRRRKSFTEGVGRRVDFASTVLLLAFSGFAPIYIYAALINSEGGFLYIRSGILYSNPVVYAFGVFPVLVWLAVYVSRPWVLWTGRVLLCSLAVFISVTAFMASVYDGDSISRWMYSINPVIYPVAQVVSSKTLLVDCAPLYGLYPHFLEPVFRVVPFSVYSFTVLMGGLYLVCLYSMWFFLSKLVKNEVVLYVGFIAAVFYSHVGVKTILSKMRPDPYFQYAPIRMLFPCLLLPLSLAYLRNPGSRWVYCLNFCIASLAILWNPDAGVVVFGAWVLLIIYIELFSRSLTAALGPILRHLAMAFLMIAMVYVGYGLFAFLRSGVWPDWGMIQKYYKLFSYYGYFMLPMKRLPHMWGVLVFIYLVSMAVSIRGLFRGLDVDFYGSLFLLTILGVGLFAYYQGRSHDYCLLALLSFPILILTIFIDRVFQGVVSRERRYYVLIPIAALCFYFCASAAPSVVIRRAVFLRWISEGAGSSVGGGGGVNSENINFIKKNTKPGEAVFILVSDYADGIYYAESSTLSALDIASSTDWFFMSDIDKAMHSIGNNHSFKVFAYPGQYTKFNESFGRYYRVAARDAETGLVMYLPVVRILETAGD